MAKATARHLYGQIDKLAKFLLKNFQHEFGHNEGAVDMAIRILDKVKTMYDNLDTHNVERELICRELTSKLLVALPPTVSVNHKVYTINVELDYTYNVSIRLRDDYIVVDKDDVSECKMIGPNEHKLDKIYLNDPECFDKVVDKTCKTISELAGKRVQHFQAIVDIIKNDKRGA